MPLLPWSKRHFFMHCQNFSNQGNVLFDDLNSMNSEIVKMCENEIVHVLLFGNKSFLKDMNFSIVTSSVRFIKESKRFDESLCSWEKAFWYIFTGIKVWKYFFTFCISVLCDLSAVKSSKVYLCVYNCVISYISLFFKV